MLPHQVANCLILKGKHNSFSSDEMFDSLANCLILKGKHNLIIFDNTVGSVANCLILKGKHNSSECYFKIL